MLETRRGPETNGAEMDTHDQETPETPELPPESQDSDLPGEPSSDDVVVAAEDSPPPQPKPKVLTIPTRRMAAIKKAERDRGRTELQSSIDQRAVELGYESWDDMTAQLATRNQPSSGRRTRARPAQQQAPEPDVEYELEPEETEPEPPRQPRRTRSQPRNNSRQLEQENARLLEGQRRANLARAAEEKKRRALQRQLDAQAADNELRIAATRAGVQDVDYAIHLLRKELNGKSADELEGFNEAEFFSKTLRKSSPYLYQVEQRRANTSPEPDSANRGGPPPSRPPNGSGSERSGIDDRTPREQYEARLKELGLTHPAVGMPS